MNKSSNKNVLKVSCICVFILVLVLVASVLLTNTFGKTFDNAKSLDIEKFVDVTRGIEYSVPVFAGTGEQSITDYRVASAKGYEIEFFTFDNQEDAKEFFDNIISKYSMLVANGNPVEEKYGNNYSKYTVSSEKEYMYIYRVEDKIASLYVKDLNAKQKAIDDFESIIL